MRIALAPYVYIVCLLLPPGPAAAEEESRTPVQAADAALAAARAHDDAALTALAAKDEPDPWLVADVLLSRGESDAATSFAKAATGVANERLLTYVSSARPVAADVRDALRAAADQLARGDAVAALKTLDGSPIEGENVPAVLHARHRGSALRASQSLGKSAEAFARAATLAETLGWLRMAEETRHEAGTSAYLGSDLEMALEQWTRRLEIAQRLGSRAFEASALGNIGLLYELAGRYADALAWQKRSLAIREELGQARGLAAVHANLGNVYLGMGKLEQALASQQKALRYAEELQDPAEVARTLANIGAIHASLGQFEAARDHARHALNLYEDLGDRRGMATTSLNLGVALQALGRLEEAHASFDRASELAARAQDLRIFAKALHALGVLADQLGDTEEALQYLQQALETETQLGLRANQAATLGSLGSVHTLRGSYGEALAAHLQSLAIRQELEDGPGIAIVLGNIGSVHHHRGDFATALTYFEQSRELARSLGAQSDYATATANLANTLATIGQSERAHELLEEAFGVFQGIHAPVGMASILLSIGTLCSDEGLWERAEENYVRAAGLLIEAKDPELEATVLLSVAGVRGARGDHAAALEAATKARTRLLALDRPVAAANAVVLRGDALSALGRHAEALAAGREALATAREHGAVPVELRALACTTRAYRDLGRRAESIAAATEAIDVASTLASGHAEETGALARESLAGIYDLAAGIALSQTDPGVAFRFLDSGRAGLLSEALRARSALREVLLPPDLLAADRKAQAREVATLQAFRRAVRAGKLADVKERRGAWLAAQEQRRGVVDRIQREAKSAAQIVSPRAAALADVQRELDVAEALVLYHVSSDMAGALVVRRDRARIVKLPAAKEIGAAVDALLAGDLHVDPSRIPALKRLLVDPLALEADVDHVLVSPVGRLAYVPYALLMPEKLVAFVPSGTTYRILKGEAGNLGEKVLAFGDPDYRTNAAASAPRTRAGAVAGLSALPATRAEVEAIADTAVLGKDATESGLQEAIGRRARWRAVHLACHGLVDPQRPMLSSLALTADKENDGFLTALEVFRMKIPADLVVLSACETGTGRIYRSEGVVGLTRAFMFAGAPRVVCSLWKVDDEATRALMVKFYESWDPKDGKQGLGAAAALKRAQEYVRSQDPWKHPYYWAAWVLWGLPE